MAAVKEAGTDTPPTYRWPCRRNFMSWTLRIVTERSSRSTQRRFYQSAVTPEDGSRGEVIAELPSTVSRSTATSLDVVRTALLQLQHAATELNARRLEATARQILPQFAQFFVCQMWMLLITWVTEAWPTRQYSVEHIQCTSAKINDYKNSTFSPGSLVNLSHIANIVCKCINFFCTAKVQMCPTLQNDLSANSKVSWKVLQDP